MKFTEVEKLICLAIINKGYTGLPFDLSQDFKKVLLDVHNIKIQKAESGSICFHAHKVGEGKVATSSGEAFCLFLKSKGCVLNETQPDESIRIFCIKNFS